jgi:hypothetical protein
VDNADVWNNVLDIEMGLTEIFLILAVNRRSEKIMCSESLKLINSQVSFPQAAVEFEGEVHLHRRLAIMRDTCLC